MKHKLSTLLACLVLITIGYSQPNGLFNDYWGKVTPDDFHIKECSFDKAADALMLLDLGDVYYNDEGNFFSGNKFAVTTAYYQRVKVFTERGVEQANYRARYLHSAKETITSVKAIAYNLSASGEVQVTSLDPADVHYKKLNDYETEVTFTVPGVKVGSVFEMTYKRKQYLSYKLPDWFFQSDIPCLESKLRVGFLDAIDYYVYKQVSHDSFYIEQKPFIPGISVAGNSYGFAAITEKDLKGTMVSYIARNLPAVTDEIYMNSRANYLDHVKFQLKRFNPPFNIYNAVLNNWEDYNDKLLNDPYWGGNILSGGIPLKLLKPLVANLTDTLSKAKAVFEYVRNSMTFDGVYTIHTDKLNADTWKQKTGNTAGINLLLINALRKIGVNAFPMLTGLRQYGYLHTSYPILDQYKKMVAVIEHNNQVYVMDATNRFLPFGQPPYEILNNYGYIIKGTSDYYWHRILNQGQNIESTYIKAAIDENNQLRGTETYIAGNYAMARYRMLKAAGRQTDINEMMKKRQPNIAIENYTDTIDEGAGRYTQNINFTAQPVTDNNGNFYISTLWLFEKSENDFVNPDRISAVDFGYTQKINGVFQLEIPNGYVVDSLPELVSLATADTGVVLIFDAEIVGNQLLLRYRLNYNHSIYQRRQYSDFYEFHQRMYKMLQQPVVLRKKE